MRVQVIETKRQPPMWGVKKGHRYQAVFIGADARAKAEAYAAENYGTFEVVERVTTGKEHRRLKRAG